MSYSYNSYNALKDYEKRQKEQKERELKLLNFIYKIGVSLCMLISIIGSLFVAWLLKVFGFYAGVFVPFVEPLVGFAVTTGFYYGAFVAVGLICWVVTAIFSNNHK